MSEDKNKGLNQEKITERIQALDLYYSNSAKEWREIDKLNVSEETEKLINHSLKDTHNKIKQFQENLKTLNIASLSHKVGEILLKDLEKLEQSKNKFEPDFNLSKKEASLFTEINALSQVFTAKQNLWKAVLKDVSKETQKRIETDLTKLAFKFSQLKPTKRRTMENDLIAIRNNFEQFKPEIIQFNTNYLLAQKEQQETILKKKNEHEKEIGIGKYGARELTDKEEKEQEFSVFYKTRNKARVPPTLPKNGDKPSSATFK